MKQKSLATDLAYVAVFTALIIVLAFVSIPIGTAGVPIVMQNAALILTGLVLGGRRGIYVGLLFLVLGLALPVLAGGGTTLRAFAGPTAGYIIAYVLSTAVAGIVADQAPRKSAGMAIPLTLAAFVRLAVQYTWGAIGLMVRSGLEVAPPFAAQVPIPRADGATIVLVS